MQLYLAAICFAVIFENIILTFFGGGGGGDGVAGGGGGEGVVFRFSVSDS